MDNDAATRETVKQILNVTSHDALSRRVEELQAEYMCLRGMFDAGEINEVKITAYGNVLHRVYRDENGKVVEWHSMNEHGFI